MHFTLKQKENEHHCRFSWKTN